MGIADWLRRVAAAPAWDGTTGAPPSGNAASSFHLFWDVPARTWVEAEATIEILVPPVVNRLYFWAMQVTFTSGGRAGTAGGAGHLGPQWVTPRGGMAAVNWGGYASSGGELDGTVSALPSIDGNVNTREFHWQPGRPYRLRVHAPAGAAAPAGLTAWRGEIEDRSTGEVAVVRDLFARGDTLESPMVWSEVFAHCDEPQVVVRWSDLTMTAAGGERVPITRASVNYQSLADGGCVTTDIGVDDVGFVQRTATTRSTPPGARLSIG